MRGTVMSLVEQETLTLSVCVRLCHIIYPLTITEPIGSMGGVKLFAAHGTISSLALVIRHRLLSSIELPERETLIRRKHDVLARFLHILNPLVEIYKIPKSSLHIFADKEGQLVAFNRGGSLFMNLRYFEAWRTS
jgi:hypothetical protein